MGKTEEEIHVIRVPDKDRYIIFLNKREEVNYEELSKIYGDVDKALQDTKKQIEEIPDQVTAREKMLREQLNTLESRIKAFGEHMKPATEDPSIG
jgi:predicted  nucleic acid-binding Zn-ribbon protein